MPDFRTETERLVLRRERPGDRAVWRKHINTPAVMAHLGGPATAEQVERSFDRMAEESDLPFLLVERKIDGALIGKCGLSLVQTACAPDSLKDQVQIGWTIREDCWGLGYGEESARPIMIFAFDKLGREMLFGQTSEANRPSWELMERLGMRRCPELDYEDPDYPAAENPTIVFRISRTDWTARHG